MIVRILSDNQYRLDDPHKPAFAQLDDRLLEAVQQDDQVAFAHWLSQVVRLIQENGQPVPPHELVASDLIVPAPDMTLLEAKHYLKSPVSVP
jgi:hypothetical protein